MKTINQISFLIFVLVTLNSYGQEKTPETSECDFRKVRIGINVSPDICFRKLTNNDGSSTSDLVMKLRNKNEIVKLGYSTGLNIFVDVTNVIGIESGIQYSNKGYQTKMIDLIFPQQEPSVNKAKFIYNFHYIDIPFKLNYTTGRNKINIFTSVGIIANVFIKETVTCILVFTDQNDRKTSHTNYPYNMINISPTISFGIGYNLNERMNLRIEPIFRYGVLKIIETPVSGYLFNGGLSLSYYYKL